MLISIKPIKPPILKNHPYNKTGILMLIFLPYSSTRFPLGMYCIVVVILWLWVICSVLFLAKQVSKTTIDTRKSASATEGMTCMFHHQTKEFNSTDSIPND